MPRSTAKKQLPAFVPTAKPTGCIDLLGELPTNSQYGDTVTQALQDSGLSPAEVQRLSDLAAQKRAAYGLSRDDLVPNAPRKIYQSGGS